MIQERTWHETQRLERLIPEPTLFESCGNESNAMLATFRLGEMEVFKGWIKGFGEHAEILRPAWLRQQIHD